MNKRKRLVMLTVLLLAAAAALSPHLVRAHGGTARTAPSAAA